MALEVKGFHGMSIALKRTRKGALAMNLVFLLITGIVALGFYYIVLPYTLARYRRFRYRKILTCPETQSLVEVALDARRASRRGRQGGDIVVRIIRGSRQRHRIARIHEQPRRPGLDDRRHVDMIVDDINEHIKRCRSVPEIVGHPHRAGAHRGGGTSEHP